MVVPSSHVLLGDPKEHRRRVQQAASERAAQRTSELESQASPAKEPRERIGIWEQLHALRLPQASGHVLVRVIAKQTRLTVAQVHEEQQRRAVLAAVGTCDPDGSRRVTTACIDGP